MLFHSNGLVANGEIFCHGFLSVDVFFILSGFVLAHRYEERLSTVLGPAAFTWIRLKRLAPVYWSGTILGACTMAVIAAYHPGGRFFNDASILVLFAMAMALVPQLILGGDAYPANTVAWSLAGELFVNFLFARWLVRWNTERLVTLVIVGWSLCATYTYLNPCGWAFGPHASDVLLSPLRAIPGFFTGVLLFRGWKKGLLERLPVVPPMIVLAVWAILTEVPTYGPAPTFEILTVVLISPVLIMLLIRSPEVAPRPLLWLGAISYPLYAAHTAVINLAKFTPLFGLDHGPNRLRAAIVFTCAIGLAWVIHKAIEQKRPFRRMASGSASA
jgi:peptidoglycan/LPS O-acetylase OafA/YrhL